MDLLRITLQNFILTKVNAFLENTTLHSYIYMCISFTFLAIFFYPCIAYFFKYIKAVMHPIIFNHKHILITGCGSGLGKALVQDLYLKGAYITMIGRSREKLQKVASLIDVIMSLKVIVIKVQCTPH